MYDLYFEILGSFQATQFYTKTVVNTVLLRLKQWFDSINVRPMSKVSRYKNVHEIYIWFGFALFCWILSIDENVLYGCFTGGTLTLYVLNF